MSSDRNLQTFFPVKESRFRLNVSTSMLHNTRTESSDFEAIVLPCKPEYFSSMRESIMLSASDENSSDISDFRESKGCAANQLVNSHLDGHAVNRKACNAPTISHETSTTACSGTATGSQRIRPIPQRQGCLSPY